MDTSPDVANLPLSSSGWNLKDSREKMGDKFKGYKAVVIGGGTGAPVSIKTLLAMGVETSAVVAMTDDGGSTGLIREVTDAIPPGDIRKCLTAMAADGSDPMVEAFKYRFNYAYNHTLGNLMITALADVSSFTQAISICENILGCIGHVYPSTLDHITLEGITRDGRLLHGQSTIAHSDTALDHVWVSPENPAPYRPALKAIREADMIVLGPGSLFTSIIPNLLIPGVVDAIKQSGAKTVFLCSVADMQGETWGLDCSEHVQALLDHGMRDILHVVCINSVKKTPDANSTAEMVALGKIDPKDVQIREFETFSADSDEVPGSNIATPKSRVLRRVPVNVEIVNRIKRSVPIVIERQLADPIFPTWHSPRVLGEVFKGVLGLCRSPEK
ncbi:MAG: gluconeogenesis factor YvcK family protein [Coriobacteriales bacterium]|jgi:uncharacterized cofD-like protein